MTIYLKERDIEFVVGAIKLIKETNATVAVKDDSVTSGHKLMVYENDEDEIVIAATQFEEEKEKTE